MKSFSLDFYFLEFRRAFEDRNGAIIFNFFLFFCCVFFLSDP